jgi:translation initiation factor 3 subunit A
MAAREAWERQERERLLKEEEERKQAELKKIEEKLEKERMEALLAQAGDAQLDVAKLAAKHLDQAALQRAVNEKLLKAREEENRKRAEQARRVDYLVRALRETERAKLDVLLKATLEADAAYVAKYNADNLAARRATFDGATAIKGKIGRMLPYAEEFESRVLAKRQELYAVQKVSTAQRSAAPQIHASSSA